MDEPYKIKQAPLALDKKREQRVWWECSECQRKVAHDAKYCDDCGVKFSVVE